MKSLARLKQEQGLDNEDLAELLGVDVLTIAMFENGVGQLHLQTFAGLSEVLECEYEDIIPELDDMTERLDACANDAERYDLLMAQHELLAQHGIDPDPEHWFISVTMKSGREVRYRASSAEAERFKQVIADPRETGDYMVFAADCRSIIVRKSQISSARVVTNLSCAQFSSAEGKFVMTILRRDQQAALHLVMRPDDGPGGTIGTIVSTVAEKGIILPFICYGDDSSTFYVATSDVDVIEIPAGLLMPELYGEEPLPQATADSDLDSLQPLGTA